MIGVDLRTGFAQLMFFVVVAAVLGASAFFVFWDSEEGVTSKPPSAEGPWAFQVHNTDGLGLKVRSCPYADCGCQGATCAQLGLALDSETVWADCRANTGFDPVGEGDQWLRIRWSNGQGGVTDVGVSTHQAEYDGWVYAGYARPLGHNGGIPICDVQAAGTAASDS